MRRKSRAGQLPDAAAAPANKHTTRAGRDVKPAALESSPSGQALQELKREIERLGRESKQALDIVEEIYGEKRPDMRVVPGRGD